MLTMERNAIERRKAFGRALAEALTVREMTQQQLAQHLGVTQSAVSSWRSGEKEPAPETVFDVERNLGLPAGHLSQHLGYLPPADDAERTQSFEDVVMSDPLLDEVQKRGLLAIYREWMAEQNPRRRRKS